MTSRGRTNEELRQKVGHEGPRKELLNGRTNGELSCTVSCCDDGGMAPWTSRTAFVVALSLGSFKWPL